MQTMPRKPLQVVLTAGPDEAAKARLGLEAALAAVAAGLDVGLFLTLAAADWACAERPTANDADVYLLLDQLQQLGVAVTCCARCAVQQCADDRVATATGLAAGIDAVGLTQLVERVANGVPTVTF